MIIPKELEEELKRMHRCPVCDKGKLVIKKDTVSTIRHEKVLKIPSWFYYCENCKEEFTTTLSDEVSFNN